MTRLPRIKGKDLIRALERSGFTIQRTRETLGPGLLRAILRDIEMTADQLRELL